MIQEMKILDLWQAPDQSGEPIGCLATSFTFDSGEFEEECLSRFLNLSSDSKTEGQIHLMELETRLQQIAMSTAFVDAYHAHGKRSPRWTIAPVKVQGGVFHPKVQLLIWEKFIRIIVGSPNLSQSGLRSNSELFFYVDFSEGSEARQELAFDVFSFFENINKISNTSEINKANVAQLLVRAKALTRSFNLIEPDLYYEFAPVLPKAASIFSRMEKLKGNVVFDEAIIESPSFDIPGSKNEAAEEVWELLRKKGTAEVCYHVQGRICSDKKFELLAPPEIAKAQRANSHISIKMYDGESNSQIRPLHSKCIHLKNERYSLLMVGSSNFSQLGLGLRKNGPSNIEANILFWIDRQKVKKSDSFLTNVFLGTIDVDLENALWLPQKNFDDIKDALNSPFPSFISHIDFIRKDNTSYYEIGLEGELVDFSVASADKSFLHSISKNPPTPIRIMTDQLMPYSELEIRWDKHSCLYPVNIHSQDCLPTPDYLLNLSLEDITRLLNSNVPLQKALQRLIRSKVEEENKLLASYDPHALVKTSHFILQRTRQFSWAMTALRKNIEQGAQTVEQLRWRLQGPLGVESVKNAVLRSLTDSEEIAFFLAEILAEVKRYKIPPSKTLSKAEISKELSLMVAKLQSELSAVAKDATPTLKKYIQSLEQISVE
jgi:HKD family nuclease